MRKIKDLIELAHDAGGGEEGAIAAKLEVLNELKQMNPQEFCKAATSVLADVNTREYLMEIRLPMVLETAGNVVLRRG